MTLLFYSPQFHPSIGGLQNVVQGWAIELAKIGHNIIVITEEAFEKSEPFEFKVMRNPSFWLQVAEMRRCDYVVMFNVSLKAIPQWILSGKPLIINHQTALYYPNSPIPFRQKLKRWVANNWANKNISCSRYIANTYKQSSVVLNPYNHELFRNLHLRRHNKFIFVGRLVSDKGVDVLLLAFKRLVASVAGNYTLTIVGNGQDYQKLQDIITGANLQKRVNIIGFAVGASLVQLINEHEVMIVPSRMEPFGIVALEGLACGCRMIVSNTGGLPEACGGFATLFQSENVDELTACLKNCLHDHVEELNQADLAAHLATCTTRVSAGLFINQINNEGY